MGIIGKYKFNNSKPGDMCKICKIGKLKIKVIGKGEDNEYLVCDKCSIIYIFNE